MNKWLKGNGYWCQACGGTGSGKVITDVIEYEGGTFAAFRGRCPACRGERRLAADPAHVVAGTVPATPQPEPTCFPDTIVYGKLTKTGRLPRWVR